MISISHYLQDDWNRKDSGMKSILAGGTILSNYRTWCPHVITESSFGGNYHETSN